MPDKIIDRWIECLGCSAKWPQSNNEPKFCPICGDKRLVHKCTSLTETAHFAATDPERRDAIDYANNLLKVRAEEAQARAGRRGRRRFFNVPRGL